MFLSKPLITIMTILMLSACAVGPNFKPTPAPEIQSYTEETIPDKTAATNVHGGDAQHIVNDEDIPALWWTLFQSPELNTLIERGLAHNPTLKAADATLREAQANLWVQIGGTLLPKIVAVGYGERQQIADFAITTGINLFNFTPGPYNLYNTTASLTYTLDVFGGARRNVEYYKAQVDYQKYELIAAYLTLTSNIVSTTITEASLRAQINATKQIIKLLENQVQIVKRQFQLGGVSNLSVLSQETQLEQTRALLPPLEKNLALTRDSLAVLIGEAPGNAFLPDFDLEKLVLPTNLPLSVPSSLLLQRPDVAAAEALVHAACAQIGVATANLLPSFTINPTYGSEAATPKGLFGPGTVLWTVQGQVTQILFNGGALLAARRASIANYDAVFAQYRQVVLNALQNVADTLNSLEIDARALQINYEAEEVARKNLDINRIQYKVGGISYISLITAEQQYVQAVINRITSQAARYTDTAALFQAMGGGWWNLQNVKVEDVIEVKETKNEISVSEEIIEIESDSNVKQN